MKNLIKVFSLVLILSLLLGACAAPTAVPTADSIAAPTDKPTSEIDPAVEPAAADEDVLYLNLTWHQHQPLYYKDDNGVYTRPWVRVHATKDYYDMAAMVKPYPNVHMTVILLLC